MYFYKRKYKARIYIKQHPRILRHISYLLFIIFTLVLITIEITLKNTLLPQFSISKSIYLVSILLITISILTSWHFSTYSLNKILKTKFLLKKIIRYNNFYFAFPDENLVRTSMVIYYYWENANLYLEVHSTGGSYTSKINDLGKIFETTFNMTIFSIQNDFSSHTTYCLSPNIAINFDATNMWGD